MAVPLTGAVLLLGHGLRDVVLLADQGAADEIVRIPVIEYLLVAVLVLLSWLGVLGGQTAPVARSVAICSSS